MIPDAPIEIEHRARGSQSWRVVRHGRTGADGRFSGTVLTPKQPDEGRDRWRLVVGRSP
jgi:hypothetical protein